MPPQYSFSTSTPGLQLTEEQRRRRLLDQELGELRERVSNQDYEKLLKAQKNQTPISQVDQKLGYTPVGSSRKQEVESRGRDTAEVEKSMDRLGRSSQQQGPTYEGSLSNARERGIYGEDFDPNLFTQSAFEKIASASGGRRRKQTTTDQRLELRILEEEKDNFERTRQQLTENYERMDPFARSQYNQMNKRIMGLERARNSGRVSPVEYLRAMDTLSTQAKQVKWKYHFRQPGQGRGEISTNEQGMVMFQGEKGPEIVGLTPDYVKQNQVTLDDGRVLIPSLGKSGRVEMIELEKGEKASNFKEMREVEKEYDDVVDKQFLELQKSWKEFNPGEIPTEQEYQRWNKEAENYAKWKLKNRRDAARALYDDEYQDEQPGRPDQPSPEQQALMQQEMQAAGEQGRQEGMQQGLQEQAAVQEEAVLQVMENKKLDRQQAERLVKDDQYYQKNAEPGMAIRSRLSSQPREVQPPQAVSYQSMLKKAKNAKEFHAVQAEYWYRDPLLSKKVDNPIPYAPGMKKEPQEVYLVQRPDGKGYHRVWYINKKNSIIIQPEEELERERSQRRLKSRRKGEPINPFVAQLGSI
jgi:hypothetical protein